MLKATSHKLLEVACFDAESCFLAEQAGADRIEFCSDYSSGGVTPLWDDISKVRERLKIPLHVIVRPRAGNFVYSIEEIERMKRDILFCKEHKVDGVVFGVLTNNQEIDIQANQELIGLCTELSCTFHRAVDACPDIEVALEKMIELGFNKVLTSGGKATAEEGITTLQTLQKHYGTRISIMPGGGIRSHNIVLLSASTGCKAFHTAAITSGNQVDTEELKSIIRHLKQDA